MKNVKTNIMKFLSFLLPDWLISLLATSTAYLLRATGSRSASVIEGRVRGFFMGPRFGAKGLFVGANVQFAGDGGISIGKNVSIHPGSQLIAGSNGHVVIGDNSHVSRNSVLAGAGGITIGQHTKISSGVMIYTVTYDRSKAPRLRSAPAKHLPVVIGDDVHIGANATVLPGVTIGDNATIGAGAVVTKDVASGTTVIGVPARPIALP